MTALKAQGSSIFCYIICNKYQSVSLQRTQMHSASLCMYHHLHLSNEAQMQAGRFSLTWFPIVHKRHGQRATSIDATVQSKRKEGPTVKRPLSTTKQKVEKDGGLVEEVDGLWPCTPRYWTEQRPRQLGEVSTEVTSEKRRYELRHKVLRCESMEYSNTSGLVALGNGNGNGTQGLGRAKHVNGLK